MVVAVDLVIVVYRLAVAWGFVRIEFVVRVDLCFRL